MKRWSWPCLTLSLACATAESPWSVPATRGLDLSDAGASEGAAPDVLDAGGLPTAVEFGDVSTEQGPDLAPLSSQGRPGLFGLCQRDGLALRVSIENRGSLAAPASLTRVTFVADEREWQPLDLPTPPLAAGQHVQLDALEVPAECFIPDCFFALRADVAGCVSELDETNNLGLGICPAARD